MAQVLIYYAHPGHRFSRVNSRMKQVAERVSDVTFADLYAEYPRFDINTEREQQRLRDHDVIVFQFPVFWYSSPALIKEWQDLVLEHGFAYGAGGEALYGKRMLLAVTTGGPEEAYSEDGYQHFNLRTFLTPFEQTAMLCGMSFETPYVFYAALKRAGSDAAEEHARSYRTLIEALRDDRLDFDKARARPTLDAGTLPLRQDA